MPDEKGRGHSCIFLLFYPVQDISNMYSALRARICRLVWCPGAFMVMLFPAYGYVMLAKSFLRQVRYKYRCKSPFIHMPVFAG
ncbi:putative membrane protein SpoIIM required for sporulation [Peribacillus frigoritolerans]|nr:putative membrane protein SpoIIM required for sporulation [Peribacillus frigoritolerans]